MTLLDTHDAPELADDVAPIGGADDVAPKPEPERQRRGWFGGRNRQQQAPGELGPLSRKDASSLEKRLAAVLTGLSAPVAFIDPYDSQVIRLAAPDLAKALTKLAGENPKVRQLLESLLTAGAWGEVITVTLTGVVLPIAIHHGAFGDTGKLLAVMFGGTDDNGVPTPIPIKERRSDPDEGAERDRSPSDLG